MKPKTIYELELHEALQLEDVQIIRVAGGWIYRYWDYVKKDYYADSTFVPYNNEFYKNNENVELPSASDQIRKVVDF